MYFKFLFLFFIQMNQWHSGWPIANLCAIISLIREVDLHPSWIHPLRGFIHKNSVSLHKNDSMFSLLGPLSVLPVSNTRLFGVLHLVDILIHTDWKFVFHIAKVSWRLCPRYRCFRGILNTSHAYYALLGSSYTLSGFKIHGLYVRLRLFWIIKTQSKT